jgi:creatinine amidohydrolase
MKALRYETAHPDDLEAALRAAPVAYVPLGTYEHHGWHLPVGFDAIKAHALCLRSAERTGGVVLPPFYYGTGGGHLGYKWTVILDEALVRPLIETTLDHLARFGFRVIVLLTGHYAGEQVALARALAEAAVERHPGSRFIGLTEPDVTTPLAGDAYPGDHAAKYETSLGLALEPEWVRMDLLQGGHGAEEVTIAQTPRREGKQWDPESPLYAIWGDDPRVAASKEIGQTLVEEITRRLAERVDQALRDLTGG